jgi:hypothetical protein
MFFVHEGIISAVNRVELVSDRATNIVLRGRWCAIIVLKIHVAKKVKNYCVKDSFYQFLTATELHQFYI